MKRIRFGFAMLAVLFVFALWMTANADGSPLPTPTSPLPTPTSPLPTPTPPNGGGENGGEIDWLGWLMENWPRIIELVLLVIALIGSLLGYRGLRRRGVTVKGLIARLRR